MLWKCQSDGCGALFAPGTQACPQCGGNSYRQAPGGEPEGETLTCPQAPTTEPEPAAAEQSVQAPAEPAPKKKARPTPAPVPAEPEPVADAPAAG